MKALSMLFRFTRSWTFIFGIGAFLLAGSPALAQSTNPAQIVLEAELGVGDGITMPRSNASQKQDVLLFAGQRRTFNWVAPSKAKYKIFLRYSNDHSVPPLEEIHVYLDGLSLGSITTLDTGDRGSGWNQFLLSPTVAEVEVLPGPHTFATGVSSGDRWGVEIDMLLLEPITDTPPPQPTQILLEGEDGTGAGLLRSRSQASGGKTVWLQFGQTRNFTFNLSASASHQFSLRYSNDHFGGPLELIEVRLDGTPIGNLLALDTGDHGLGWNSFLWASFAPNIALAPGPHTLSATILNEGDGYGVELDLIRLEPLP
jgi:hypothetical protein